MEGQGGWPTVVEDRTTLPLAVWGLLVLFTLSMAIRKTASGPRPLPEVLGRLGAIVSGVAGAVGVLAGTAGTA